MQEAEKGREGRSWGKGISVFISEREGGCRPAPSLCVCVQYTAVKGLGSETRLVKIHI